MKMKEYKIENDTYRIKVTKSNPVRYIVQRKAFLGIWMLASESEEEYYDVGHGESEIWDGSEPYSGRFDSTKKQVSLTCKTQFKFKEIPELLLDRLYREFGVDITIYDFTR